MEENADPIIATLSVERKTSERKARKRKLREPAPKAPSLDISSLLNRELSECEMDVTAEISVESPMTCENSTQTIAVRKAFVAARLENKILHNEMLIKMQPITKELNLLSFGIIYGDRKKFKYFTGVYPEQFDTLFEFLGPAKHSLVYWSSKSVNGDQKPSKIKKLSLREQMFVTPLRLRRGFRLYTPAHFYSGSEVTIRCKFTTWIMFLFQHFEDYKMLMFPDRHSFKRSNPAVFRYFKNIRCIVDCTEYTVYCGLYGIYGVLCTEYTVYCGLYGIYGVLWTVRNIRCIVDCTEYTVYCGLYGIYGVLWTVRNIRCIVDCTEYTVYCGLYGIYGVLWTVRNIRCIVDCTEYTVYCGLYGIYGVLWTVRNIRCIVDCTEYTVYCGLYGTVYCGLRNIRCIVDCTEYTVRDYGRQGNFYSSYKHHCTMKCLIAITVPSGGTCFVSDLYEGSVDDVKIFAESGILEYINPEDSVMVDKGFNVQELLLTKQATIFIPPFLGNREKIHKRRGCIPQKNRQSTYTCGAL